MHRRPIVIANWKMHTNLAEAEILAWRVSQVAERVDDIDLVLLPPVIWLPSLLESLHHRPRSLHFGVQNFYPLAEGDLTGEIGTAMLKGLATYALIGHSDRRLHFGETDEVVREKLHAALKSGLAPILCVGELTKVVLKARTRGRPTVLERKSDILKQLRSAVTGLAHHQAERLIISYEPLWAIGTGLPIPAADAQAVIEQIRAVLVDELSAPVAARIRTIYGGSVTNETIADYMEQPDIDGVLVGKASLEAKTFLPLAEAVANRVHHRIQHADH